MFFTFIISFFVLLVLPLRLTFGAAAGVAMLPAILYGVVECIMGVV